MEPRIVLFFSHLGICNCVQTNINSLSVYWSSHTMYVRLSDLHVGVPLILSGPQTYVEEKQRR